MSDLTPMIEGRYRLESVLGRGGTGVVYRAFDVRLDRAVAVKLLRDADGADEARFQAEARILARFSHPNLVRVLDAGEFDGRPFLVTEIIEGATLANRLATGPLSRAEVVTIGTGISSALEYVHRAGIVHRDVKPANILIDQEGDAHLLDFGIARLIDATGMTAAGITVGTLAYLAPEQIQGIAVSGAADVYALGLVLLECLVGHRSFDGTASEVMAARLGRDPGIPADLDPSWTRLLRTMTARDPSDRPPSAEVVAQIRMLPSVAQPSSALIGDAGISDATGTFLAAGVDDTERLVATSTALHEVPSGSEATGSAPRAGGVRRSRAVAFAGIVVVAAVVVGLAIGGFFFYRLTRNPPVEADPPTASSTTSIAPLTTTSTLSTTTTTSTSVPATTTTLPVASVESAASAVGSVVESAVSAGDLSYPAAQQLDGQLQAIISSAASGAQQQAVQQFDQLAAMVAQDVADQAVTGYATISALGASLSSLASALGTSVPTTTTTTVASGPIPGPFGNGHGHGHGH